MTWHPYVTRQPHGRHPAGSACRVRENPDDWKMVDLEFEDGEVIGLVRSAWAFPGTPVVGGGGPLWLMGEQIARDIDEEMLKGIDAALG